MSATAEQNRVQNMSPRPVVIVRRLLELVKIEHTLFALPLALTGAVLAARGIPALRTLGLVLVAFTAARTAAMAFNRLADRHLDALNPRTANREIPTGLIKPGQVRLMLAGACGIYFLAAWALNDLCFTLSPLALAVLLGYSYTKRFTWLCHAILGLCLGLAPLAGWMAVAGTWAWAPAVLGMGVLFWVAGFDIIYACQDVDFDRATALQSVPARLGTARALRVAAISHVVAFSLFLTAGLLAGLGWQFYLLSLITAALLCLEHRLIEPTDLTRINTAFFTVNSTVSLSLLVAVWFGLD
jgi:4-hydroxybenzoate polyprenyltransferase